MTEYTYGDSSPTHANAYLWPILKAEVAARGWPVGKRAFDLGCGNGATSSMLAGLGFDVTGVDVSLSGIEQAQKSFPNVRCEVAAPTTIFRGDTGRSISSSRWRSSSTAWSPACSPRPSCRC